MTEVAKSVCGTKNVTEVTKNVTEVAKNFCGTKTVTEVTKNVLWNKKCSWEQKKFSDFRMIKTLKIPFLCGRN